MHKPKVSAPLLAWLAFVVPGIAQIITTVAGTTFTFPSTPRPAVTAPLGSGAGLAIDSQLNVYVADYDNNLVVRIAPNGALSVVAGNGSQGFSGDGGSATNASLYSPTCVAIDSSDNLYIADSYNNRIRKVSNGIITTVAGNGAIGFFGDGGKATNAGMFRPGGVAVDSAGTLFISDTYNNRIRKVSNGIITTIAGNGINGPSPDGSPATSLSLSFPKGIAIDRAGNVYFAEFFARRIRKLSGDTITTIAGNTSPGFSGDGGPATLATLREPIGIAIDSNGAVYFSDSSNDRVRKVSGGIITTVVGNGATGFSGDGGPATSASLAFPEGVAVDPTGNIYIGDAQNQRIRMVSKGIITTIGGNGQFKFSGDGGPAVSASVQSPASVAVDSAGNLYIADTGNNRIRKVSSGIISTVAGSVAGFAGDGSLATSAALYGPHGVAVDSSGNVYVADTYNSRVRKISNGIITTIAGTGTPGSSGDGGLATNAQLTSPVSVAVDSTGNIFISDSDENRIRKVSNGIISTVAGNGTAGYSGDNGPATSAALNHPNGIAVDSDGALYISDVSNNRVRKVMNGNITTVAGNGDFGSSGNGGLASNAAVVPAGVAVDNSGSIYIFDIRNSLIRRVSGGIITTFAGTGRSGFSGDGGPATSATFGAYSDQLTFSLMSGLAVDSSHNLYIVDRGNERIRKVLANSASVGYQATSTELQFVGSAGGELPSPQSVSLSSTVAGLEFSASTSSPWLSVSPLSGSMPTSLQIAVDSTKLVAGTYQGKVTVSSPAAAPATLAINVTFTVQTGSPARLSLDTPSNFTLSFSAVQGSLGHALQLRAANSGSGPLPISVSSSTSNGGSWLSVSPSSGTATPSSPVLLNVTANPGSLAPGTYSGSIVVVGAGSSITVPVTLSVEAPNRVILLSQNGLSYRALAQGGTPLSQSFGILNTGQGPMSWSAIATTLTGGPWLTISPSSGTVKQPFLDVSIVNVAVDPAGLAPGDYYGQIQVTAPSVNSPQTLTVLLTVLPTGSSLGPDIQPTGLIFTGSAGATPSSQDVNIGNPKAQSDNYLSSSIGTSFHFLPTNAQVLPNQPTTLHVYPDFGQLQPGTIQHGTITLQFADGTARNISILTVVAPNTAGGINAHDLAEQKFCSPLLVHPTTLTDTAAHVSVGQAVHLAARVLDSCGNAVTSSAGSVTASFSNGDTPVTLVHVGDGNWSGTWTPLDSSQSSLVVRINASVATGTEVLSGAANVSVSAQTASTPVTFSAANAANGSTTTVSPGGLIAIYGLQLAAGAVQPSTVPFPTTIDGAQVLIGGKPLPLRYVSPGQVNAQVPFEVAINSTQQLVVKGSANRLSVPRNVTVAAADPAVYTQDGSGTGNGIVVDTKYQLLTESNPPVEGDTIVVYANALGAVDPPLATGTPAPLDGTVVRTSNSVTAMVGGVDATVSFAGLVPGYPDLFQVNIIVPCHSDDSVQLTLSVAGRTSPPVKIPKPKPGPPAGPTHLQCLRDQ